jgi:hypothetical protein
LETKTKRLLSERIRRDVARSLKEHGFSRSKPTFYTRVFEGRVEFIHIHLFSFAPALRIHLGIRYASDSFEAVALNGPTSDETSWRSKLYFEESEESVAICGQEVLKYVEAIGLPWFESQRREGSRPASQATPDSVEVTCKLLGIPNSQLDTDGFAAGQPGR